MQRIWMTFAATIVIALVLTALLCAFGMACTPRWQVEPFTNHIAVHSPSTSIQATGVVTPQEGRYQVKETHITIQLSGRVKTVAIVREPIGASEGHAACLFMHGSGTGKSSEAYGDIARAMATAGITTLVPDKRLDNYSMLSRDYVSSANDYAKSLRVLRSWPGVDAAKTGIYAESEGTWIATVLTHEHPDLAFAILTSSPVVSGRQQMAMAATSCLKAAGAPDAIIHIIPKLTSLSVDNVGPNYADFNAAYYRRSLTMPLLINYGTQDTAMPIEQGARLLTQAANAAGNHNVTLRYYNANHQMRTGSLSAPNLPLASHYTHDLEDWVNAVAAGTGVGGWKTPMIGQPASSAVCGTAVHQCRVGLLTGLASERHHALLGVLCSGLCWRHRIADRSYGSDASPYAKQPSAQLSFPRSAAHRTHIERGVGRRDDLRVSRLSGRGGSGCDHLDEQLGYAGPRLAWRSGVVLAGTDCVRMADCAIHRHAHTMVAACSRETLAGRRTGRVLPSRWRGDLGRRPHSRFHSKYAGFGAVFAALGVLGTI